MGFDKLLSPINGIPVFMYSVCAFDLSEADELVLTVPTDKISEYERTAALYELNKPLKITAGADIRPRSALNGANAADSRCDMLLIHDAARLFVTGELIDRVILAAKLNGAAIPAVKLSDTVKFCRDGLVSSTPDRETLRAVQTPQAFIKSEYLAAVRSAGERMSGVTDDAALFEAVGKKVAVVEGDRRNFKLTTPEDAVIAEAMLAAYPDLAAKPRRKPC